MGGQNILLEGDLTLSRARELRDLLARALEGEGCAVIFGGVGDVDLSFLQILCAAHRSAGGRGAALGLGPGAVPAPVASLIARAGLAAAGTEEERNFWAGLARQGPGED